MLSRKIVMATMFMVATMMGVTHLTLMCPCWAESPTDSFEYVCQDANAGGYEAFPDVCRLTNGQLMCVFYTGYGHVSLPTESLPRGGRIAYCTSSDEGMTWSPAKILYDGPDDDRDPSIAQLRGGKLICNYFSLHRTEDPNVPYAGSGSWFLTSSDAGVTWSSPQLLAPTNYYCSSPVRELRDGRLIVGLYHVTDSDASGAVAISADGGSTWSSPIQIDNGGRRLDAETDVVQRKDGSLFAALRGDGDVPMCWSESRDGGATWSRAEPIGFLGHAPYLHRSAQEILLLGHRQPSTSLHFSHNDGETWSENTIVDKVVGAYPSMVNLKDGSVLIVYYEEGDGSSIRSRRFRVDEQGIQWISRQP